MADRKEVMTWLKICGMGDCSECCPYRNGEVRASSCYEQLMTDALSLLKAQEPYKKGYWKYPQSLDCCCSECGNQPDHESGESVPLYNYCPYCGAEMTVKWEWE